MWLALAVGRRFGRLDGETATARRGAEDAVALAAFLRALFHATAHRHGLAL